MDGDNLCAGRTNPELCEEYESLTSEICVRCNDINKVVNDVGVCVDLTVYSENCDSYANTDDCDQCLSGSRLTEGECTDFSGEEEEELERCRTINSSGECVSCYNPTDYLY